MRKSLILTGLLLLPLPSPEPCSMQLGQPIEQPTVKEQKIVPEQLEPVVQAMIHVESRGNTKCFRADGNCAGILQITPIYVEEVNRLLGEDRYSLEDRFDSIKSLEMFMVIQNYYNPGHDIEKAIQLHNKGQAYRARILGRINDQSSI